LFAGSHSPGLARRLRRVSANTTQRGRDITKCFHLPNTITRNTTLSADLTGCPANGLVIGADHVRLDLNGHTSSGQESGVGVLVSGRKDVRIRNGTVQQFADGVRFESGVTASVVRDLFASGNTNGIVLSSSDVDSTPLVMFSQLLSRFTGSGILL
jgi:hypothetical protein